LYFIVAIFKFFFLIKNQSQFIKSALDKPNKW